MKQRNIAVLALLLVVLVSGLFFFRPSGDSIQITSVDLTVSDKVPLGALATIETNVETKVEVVVKGQDNNDLARSFPDLARVHNIPVLGLYPDAVNEVAITVTSPDGKAKTITRTIRTQPLPAQYPDVEILQRDDSRVSDGLIFVHLGRYDSDGKYHPLTSAIDNYGKVRWFYTEDIGHVLKRLRNGNLAIQVGNKIAEIDMLGQPTGAEWAVPNGLHHDIDELPNGNFLALTSGETTFEDVLVEIDRKSGEVVKTWDFNAILDRNRESQPKNLREDDWLHLNAVLYDPGDNGIVVSGRDQSAVVKIDRDTDAIIWILGNHDYWTPQYSEYLLAPETPDFEWQWGQHAPMLSATGEKILVYDNGNDRSYDNPLPANANYSRAVEFQIDGKERTVSQIWQYGKERGSELFTPFIGDANYLPNGNRLICFGGITKNLAGQAIDLFDWENHRVNKMKVSTRVIEVTNQVPAEVVLEVKFANPNLDTYEGYRSYRAERMSLYP